ncbi:MAG TPA: GNAT family N-acetyltransferase [Bacteroidia bacterium]|nr:GNAT family N-acetyltransferase [Bacteroidia bacterium]
MITIRKATLADAKQIWQILRVTNSKGNSFPFLAEKDEEEKEMMAYWLANDKYAYVATEDEIILGTFYLKDNQPGRGAHIANAGYAVSEKSRGKGIGKLMGEFSLKEAKQLGYKAMQFNLVVKTNQAAVNSWKSIGFDIIGEIPQAFNHKELGFVNAYIMYQKL